MAEQLFLSSEERRVEFDRRVEERRRQKQLSLEQAYKTFCEATGWTYVATAEEKTSEPKDEKVIEGEEIEQKDW